MEFWIMVVLGVPSFFLSALMIADRLREHRKKK